MTEPNAQKSARQFTRNKSWRQQFFDVYGRRCVGTSNGESCAWLVTQEDALTVGHLFNDGAVHRGRLITAHSKSKAHGVSTTRVIQDLQRRGWPQNEGIATQCANCQLRDLRRKGRS